MTAKLPRTLEEVTVGTMLEMETRWADPSTMYAKPDRSLWLFAGTSVVSEPDKFHSMRITRGGDGYHVWPGPRHYYAVEEEDTGITTLELVPVQELHEGERRWMEPE